jgi:hypothetical protein
MTRPIFSLILLAMSGPLLAYGQDSTSTEFQTAETTTYEDAMEVLSSVVLVPLAIGSTVISIVPPSGGIVVHDGRVSGILSFETGVGFGEKVDLKRYSDARFTVGYTHIFDQDLKDFFRIEAKEDFRIGFVDRRELFLFGASPSAGLFTDFPSTGYSVGVSSWLMTPWLSYIGFIPQHTFGITYRYNVYFGGKAFGEISAGMSAAFTWGWR